jgi:hypothetical protein
MTSVPEAMAQVQQVHDNALALADPVGQAWAAQLAWMQAVSAALGELGQAATTAAEPAAKVPVVDTTEVDSKLAAMQEQITSLTSHLQAFEQKLAALFTPSTSVADASPSSSEPATIQPSNAGV